MLSAAVVVSYGLGTGFDRAARCGVPAGHRRSLQRQVAARRGRADRCAPRRRQVLDAARGDERRHRPRPPRRAARRRRRRGDRPGTAPRLRDRRAAGTFALSAPSCWSSGRSRTRGASGWATRWTCAGSARCTSSGFVEAPDNVGFPLAKPRFYVSRAAIDARFGREPNPDVNLAEIWLRDPSYVNEVLVQARDTSFGLHSITFATRAGVRILLDQAAGIVIDLLVALSLIALVTAGVMLAASARAEVQRRLGAIGVRRAVGTTRGQVTLAQALEGLLVAAPAATIGVLAGVLATYRPAARLLRAAQRAGAGRRAGAAAARSVAGGGADAGAGRGLAGVARRRRARGGLLTRRGRVEVPARRAAFRPPRRPGHARCPARRRPSRPTRRDRADARPLDRIRTADARARLGAEHAGD